MVQSRTTQDTNNMKIELNEEAATTAIVLTIAATIIALAFLVYRYNATVFEQGYTQRQLENSQTSIWVKD